MNRVRFVRPRIWAAFILCIAVVSYAALAPAPDGRSGVVRQEIAQLFRPLSAGVAWLSSSIAAVWNHYIHLTHVSIENVALHTEVAQLRAQLHETHEALAENQRLRTLLSMAGPWTHHPIAASVIGIHPVDGIQTITIDRGWADGIVRDRPVMSPDGLIGRVRVLTEHTATVLLITDPNSAIDVIDARSRIRGLLVGAVRGTTLRRNIALTQLEYVAQDSDIQEGDELMTSGMDDIYPKGLPVGRIHELDKDEFGLFKEAWVLPLATMTQLEEVLVL